MSLTFLCFASRRTTTGSSCELLPPYTRPGERVADQLNRPLWQPSICAPVCLSKITTSVLIEPDARLAFSLPTSVVSTSAPESPRSYALVTVPAKRPFALRETARSSEPASKPGSDFTAVTLPEDG